jgi:hypothetical protein
MRPPIERQSEIRRKTMPSKKKAAKKLKKGKTMKAVKPLDKFNFGDIKGESTDKDHKDWVSL